MRTSSTYLSPRNSTVMVDRAWADSLGLNRAPGARRVGNFYRLSRLEYLRALRAVREQRAAEQGFEVPAVAGARRSLSPCLGATGIESPRSDDRPKVDLAA